MTADEVLDLAADRIEWQGWYQPGGDKDGSCPLIGISTEASPNDFDAARKAEGALVTQIGGPPQAADDTIITWNDAQTDPWVVIDTMRAAARKLRGEA